MKGVGCISTHDAPISNFLNGRQANCFSHTSQAIRNKCSWLGTMTILSSSVKQGESWQLLGVFTYHLDGLWSLWRKPARLAKYPGLQMFEHRDKNTNMKTLKERCIPLSFLSITSLNLSLLFFPLNKNITMYTVCVNMPYFFLFNLSFHKFTRVEEELTLEKWLSQ